MSKYCGECGNENVSNSKYCTYCGKPIEGKESEIVDESVSTVETTSSTTKTNGLAVAGFITALVSLFINFGGIVGIVATILSGVGISKTGPGGEKGRGLAIAGLIIGIISVIYGLFSILALAGGYSLF